jgi:DNA repair exonuclease SbcCD ATPase subunit
LSPGFGFLKKKTSDFFLDKKSNSDYNQPIKDSELLHIIENEKKILEKDLIKDLEPIRTSVLDCLNRLRDNANELEEQEIKVENPQFEPLINTSKGILISSIKKESFIESSEIKNYEDAVKFKNNLELLVNRFGQVGDSHNRILNEFMRKQINKLKSEFDKISSLLKQVTKVLSVKESQINNCITCRDDLILLGEKLKEKNDKQNRLAELSQELQTIDKNIEVADREYQDFQKSEEFLDGLNFLKKSNNKKDEIAILEKNMINRVSNLSRPITKFSYEASKETQGRFAKLLNDPLEIFNDNSAYLNLFNELKRNIIEKSIKIKDPEKTIHQIEEIVDSLPSLSSNLKELKEELILLDSSTSSKNINRLNDLKMRTETYEKNRLENITKTQETKKTVEELESAANGLKKKIEDKVSEITNTKYSISQ